MSGVVCSAQCRMSVNPWDLYYQVRRQLERYRHDVLDNHNMLAKRKRHQQYQSDHCGPDIEGAIFLWSPGPYPCNCPGTCPSKPCPCHSPHGQSQHGYALEHWHSLCTLAEGQRAAGFSSFSSVRVYQSMLSSDSGWWVCTQIHHALCVLAPQPAATIFFLCPHNIPPFKPSQRSLIIIILVQTPAPHLL